MESRNHSSRSATESAGIEEIHRHFPKHTHDEVVEALEDCQRELAGSNDSTRIFECMQSRLSPQAGDGVD